MAETVTLDLALIGQAAMMGYWIRTIDLVRVYTPDEQCIGLEESRAEAWTLAVSHMQAQPGYVALGEAKEKNESEPAPIPVSCVLIEPAVLEAMREALLFYADTATWGDNDSGIPLDEDIDGVRCEGFLVGGAKARAALAKLEGEKG